MSNINYRAVHTRSKWRKVRTHKSVDSAVNGPNGAVALFAGKVRIDYEKHGKPMYAFIWEDGDLEGWAVRESAGDMEKKRVPIHLIDELERAEGSDARVISRVFN